MFEIQHSLQFVRFWAVHSCTFSNLHQLEGSLRVFAGVRDVRDGIVVDSIAMPLSSTESVRWRLAIPFIWGWTYLNCQYKISTLYSIFPYISFNQIFSIIFLFSMFCFWGILNFDKPILASPFMNHGMWPGFVGIVVFFFLDDWWVLLGHKNHGNQAMKLPWNIMEPWNWSFEMQKFHTEIPYIFLKKPSVGPRYMKSYASMGQSLLEFLQEMKAQDGPQNPSWTNIPLISIGKNRGKTENPEDVWI